MNPLNPTSTSQSEPIPNLLIVDDSPVNLQLLTGMFQRGKFKVRPAPSGELALQAARREPPDLILLDIDMPGLNGFEVCERLKADEALKTIPIIFITALDDVADKIKAFGVGGVDYVTKPFQFEEVAARVRTHLAVHRQERRLQEQLSQLKDYQRLSESLVEMIVHDIGSPVAAIQAGLALMQQSSPLSPATTAVLLENSNHACLKIQKMIADLLDIARLETGEMPTHKSPHDLVVTVRASAESVSMLAGSRTVRLELPESCRTTYDEDIMGRVVENFLLNAFKHTAPKGEITLSLAADGDYSRVSVTDNGRGIPAEFHQKVFEKFGQVELRSKMTGSGLGLAFCKLAVEAHGGQIGVESEPGRGSSFWFKLPVVPAK